MDLNGHLSTCPNCYAPAKRFCDAAKAMRIDLDSDYFAGQLVNIPHQRDREAYMAKFCKIHFDFPALKLAIFEKYKALKAQSGAAQ